MNRRSVLASGVSVVSDLADCAGSDPDDDGRPPPSDSNGVADERDSGVVEESVEDTLVLNVEMEPGDQLRVTLVNQVGPTADVEMVHDETGESVLLEDIETEGTGTLALEEGHGYTLFVVTIGGTHVGVERFSPVPSDMSVFS